LIESIAIVAAHLTGASRQRRDTSLLYNGEPNASYPRWGMFAGAFGSRWNIFDFRSGFRKVIYVQIILVRM
jgi:hypothetical protein